MGSMSKIIVLPQLENMEHKIKKVSAHSHSHYFQTLEELEIMKANGFPYIEKEGDKLFLIIKDDRRPVRPELIYPEVMLQKMKEHGIEHRFQWVSPWVLDNPATDIEQRKWFCRLHNDMLMQQWIIPHPEKFSGAAAILMDDVEFSISEIKRCYQMGYRAVTIGTTVKGMELDEKCFDPIWAALEELNMLVCVHPVEMPYKDTYWRKWRIGMPAQTAYAMDAFTFGGIFQRFPGLKVLFSHGGTNWLIDFPRSLHAFRCRKGRFVGCPDPRTFLKNIHVDAHTGSINSLEFFIKEYGVDMFCFGDDGPFPLGDYENDEDDYEVIPGRLIEEANFSPDIKESLLYKNFERLLQP